MYLCLYITHKFIYILYLSKLTLSNVFCVIFHAEVSQAKKRESCITSAANMRVLGVLKHWIAKHSQVSN